MRESLTTLAMLFLGASAIPGSMTSQTIATIAGSGVSGCGGDGGLAVEAKLDDLRGVAADASGRFCVADSLNHVIRPVDEVSGVMTTYADVTSDFSWRFLR